jgi:hypothetical protein
MLAQMAQGLADEFPELKAAIKPIMKELRSLISTAAKASAATASVGSAKSAKVPGFATGVSNFAGGLAVVGEQGPELVSLPRGASVYPNGSTATRAALAPTITVAPGAVQLTVNGDVTQDVLPLIQEQIDEAFHELAREIGAGLEG